MKKTGKAYFMISAVAQKYNIHPQTLRLYEREGLLKPSRTEGNTRLYSEEDLEQLETILSLTRSRREPGGCRDHSQHAHEDRAHAGRSERVHGVREARTLTRHRRLGAAPVDGAREVDADRSRACDATDDPDIFVIIAGSRNRHATRDRPLIYCGLRFARTSCCPHAL